MWLDNYDNPNDIDLLNTCKTNVRIKKVNIKT